MSVSRRAGARERPRRDRPPAGARPSRVPARAAVVGALLVIALLTLFPLAPRAGDRSVSGLLGGSEPLADFLRNLLLFAPLGAALRRAGQRPARVAATAAALALGVELLQLAIPGRFPNPRDVIANALGAWLAARAAGARATGLASSDPRSDRRAIVSAAGFAVMVATTGLLAAPVLPASEWYGGFTPDLGHFEQYQGRVIEARVGSLRLRGGGPAADSDALRAALRAGRALRVQALAGPAPARVAPIVTIHDERQREILLLGAAQDGVAVRLRSRAAELGLIQRWLRVPGALAGVAPGEPLDLFLRRGPRGLELRIGEQRYRVGYDASMGWSFVVFLTHVPAPVEPYLGAAWLALFAVPVGLFARPTPAGALALALPVAALTALPPLLPLLPTPGSAYAGTLIGVGLGHGLRRLLAARARRGTRA